MFLPVLPFSEKQWIFNQAVSNCFSQINMVFCNALLFESALKGKLCENIIIICLLWFYLNVSCYDHLLL